ncbi:MAG: response regulator transcription factor [Acidiferrobacterales bacterium]
MQRILIVDDDPHIREVLRFALEKAGYETSAAEDGKQALHRFDDEQPDLVVLDIMMPEMDGTEVCRALRQRSLVPIVFLSSKDEEVDRIIGLELGGDDYVTKPFSPRELVARVRAVLRRTADGHAETHTTSVEKPNIFESGPLKLDQDQFMAYWEEKEVVLTVTEFGILRTLIRHPGRVFTRDEIMSGAYDFNNIVSDRTIDSHVRRLRSKLNAVGADPIETVHGVGYKLRPL